MNFSVQLATAADFADFEALQDQVLATRLAPDARADGFVSTGFTRDELVEVVGFGGLFIARADDGAIAGSVFGLSWIYSVRRPAFK